MPCELGHKRQKFLLSINILLEIVRRLRKTPFHPYYFSFNELDKLQRYFFRKVNGLCLDVGCRSDYYKALARECGNPDEYLTLGIPSWDPHYHTELQKRRLWRFGEIVFGSVGKPDIWGDGYRLPFKSDSFDTVVSLATIEHIKDPLSFPREHSRVLKRGGPLIISFPMIFPAHGGETEDDYWRFTKAGMQNLLALCRMEAVEVKNIGSLGWTQAHLVNSFFVKRLFELDSRLVFGLTIPFLAILFSLVNVGAMLLDKLWSDSCYSAGFFFLARKALHVEK